MCEKDYENSPKIDFSNPNEEVAENLILLEKGQYICDECKSIIAEYREFKKPKNDMIGNAISKNDVNQEPIKKSLNQETENIGVSFNSIIGMDVYDENAKKIGVAKQVGINSAQSIVLAIIKNDGKIIIANWKDIKKIGEIILLGTNKVNSTSNEDIDLKCANCSFINKKGSKFCEECGTNIS